MAAIMKSLWISTKTQSSLRSTRERSVDLQLLIKRKWFGPKATIGEMYSNDGIERLSYTLEDVKREVKVPGETCIPAGKYRLILDYSSRYKRLMPRLLDVPGFSGILIHPGNTDVDTHGCVLVGRTLVNEDFVGESRRSFFDLFTILMREHSKGKMWVNIVEESGSPFPVKA